LNHLTETGYLKLYQKLIDCLCLGIVYKKYSYWGIVLHEMLILNEHGVQ